MGIIKAVAISAIVFASAVAVAVAGTTTSGGSSPAPG
jgi:hypothetical protein